jgi:hypothetical protein
MSFFFARLWSGVCYYAGWYANWIYELWIELTPLGYVAICLTCLGVGWIFLKSGTKSFGR